VKSQEVVHPGQLCDVGEDQEKASAVAWLARRWCTRSEPDL